MTAVRAADDAAAALRALNHATLAADRWPGLTGVADVYTVLEALGTGASRLPQGLGQLAGFLADRHHGGRLICTGGADAGDHAGAARIALDAAAAAARTLATALGRAQQAVADIGEVAGH